MNASLTNKAIIVTGCSRGLGLTITEKLLKAGACVTGIARSAPSELERIATTFPDRFNCLSFDLASDPKTLMSWAKEYLPLKKRLDGIVNNAAIAYDDLITNANPAQLAKMQTVNVTSAQLLTSHFIRNCLLYNTAGSIVQITSIAARQGYAGLAFYGATKAAMEAFSKTTAREWGKRGIRSNCVAPGFLETDMSAALGNENREKIFRRAALQRAASLESVAATVAFLLSDDADSVTGQVWNVDAGAS